MLRCRCGAPATFAPGSSSSVGSSSARLRQTLVIGGLAVDGEVVPDSVVTPRSDLSVGSDDAGAWCIDIEAFLLSIRWNSWESTRKQPGEVDRSWASRPSRWLR